MNTNSEKSPIDRFAAEVRLALKDLGRGEVEELTDGLEADLKAQSAEQGKAFVLPEPLEYARELREAAGLPSQSSGFFGLLERIGRMAAVAVAGNPITRSISKFFASVTPIWWFARAFFAFFLIETFLLRNPWPHNPLEMGSLVLITALVIGSVQLGRHVGTLPRVWKRVVFAFNVFAVVVAPPIFGTMSAVSLEAFALYEDGASLPVVQEGLKLNSSQVDNIFVYDESGKPLSDVQLFTQDGEPLSVGFNGVTFPVVALRNQAAQDFIYIENPRATIGKGWNVFPLKMVPVSDIGKVENGEDMSWDAVRTPLPYPSVDPLDKTKTR